MIARETVTDRLAAALRARAPDNNRSGWYMELADAIGATDESVANWCYGKRAPELHFYFALCRFFGPDFAQDVQGQLTGMHCSAEASTITSTLSEAGDLAERLADILKSAGDGRLQRIK